MSLGARIVMSERFSSVYKSPFTILSVLILASFGIPVFLGLSWMPQPFLPYLDGMPPGPAFLSGYDNFSFPHVDWPWRLLARKALIAGEWPLWNPYASLGLPFPGQYQNQLFFPLEWLEIFLDPLGWNLLFVCKVIAAGWGVLLFLARVFPNRDVQLVGSIAYCFSAYFIWFHSIAAFINGAMLAPWLFWGALRLFDESLAIANRVGALALLTGMLLLSGQPQISALCLLALAVFIVFYALGELHWRAIPRSLLLSVCSVGLGFLIASVHLALFLEIIRNGYSLHTPGAYAGGATAPLNFVLNVWPFVFGQLMWPWGDNLFPGRMNAEAWPLVVGNSGLILLLVGLLAIANCVSQRRRLPSAVVAMTVVAFMALGIVVSGTIGYNLWQVRGLDRINFPRYVTPTLSLAIAVIICWGLTEYVRMSRVYRRVLAGALLAVFAFLAFGAATALDAAPLPTDKGFEYFKYSLMETILPALLVSVTLLLGLRLISRHEDREKQLPFFAGICLLAEYAFFLRYGLPLAEDALRIVTVGITCLAARYFLLDSKRLAWMVLTVGLIFPALLLSIGSKRLDPQFDPYQLPDPARRFLQGALVGDSVGGRVLTTSQTMIPNIGNALQISELPSLNPQQIKTSATYIFKMLAPGPINYTTPNAWPGVQPGGDYPSWPDYVERRHFYNLVSVRYLVDVPTGWLSRNPQPEVQLAYSDKKLNIYEDKRAFARAFSVPSVIWVSSAEDAYSVMLSPHYDPNTTAVAEVPVGRKVHGQMLRGHGSAKPQAIEELGMNYVRIAADVSEPSVVVLSDAYYPGWKVKVNGETAEMLRVAGALRGVLVGPGIHRIEMTYRPDRFLFWLSVTTLATLLAIGLTLTPFVRRGWGALSRKRS